MYVVRVCCVCMYVHNSIATPMGKEAKRATTYVRNVCMHVYMYVYMFVSIYIYIYIYILCVCLYVHTCIAAPMGEEAKRATKGSLSLCLSFAGMLKQLIFNLMRTVGGNLYGCM